MKLPAEVKGSLRKPKTFEEKLIRFGETYEINTPEEIREHGNAQAINASFTKEEIRTYGLTKSAFKKMEKNEVK